MCKNKLILLWIFTLVLTKGLAQYVSPIPKWALVEDISSIKEIKTKEIKDGYFYVLASEQFNEVLDQDFFHYATKVVSEAGFNAVSQIEITFDPSYQKASFHFIRIHRNGKIIDKADSKSFKTLNEESERHNGILRGKKTFYRNLDDLRKGDIVEYAYSINGNNPIFKNELDYHFYFTYTVPVGMLCYKLIIPKEVTLNFKNLYLPTYSHVEKITSNGKELTWTVINPPVVTNEDNTPSWHEPYSQTQISSVRNWQDVKNWCISLFVKEKKTSPLLDDLISSVVSKYPNDKLAQINELVDFVQNQIRYSGNEQGIYSHHPHNADFVLKNRFGDCKDKSFLLCVALDKIDVKCYPALLSTTSLSHVTDFIPTMKKFNHCICAIRHNGSYAFIDPTITMQKGPFFKRQGADYEKCMVLDSTKEVFSVMPSDLESKIYFKEYYDIDDLTGDAKLQTTSIYHGINADNMRYSYASSSLNDLQESYKSYYLRYTDEIVVADSIQTTDDTINNIFTIRESYILKKFWTADKNSKEISQNILPTPINERIRYAEEATRKSPLKLYFPVNSWQEIIINKKGGWNIENSSITENNQFFFYKYETTVDKSEIKLTYTYFNKVDHIMPDDYKLYKEKTDFIDKNIVFSPTQTVGSTEQNGFNWPLVLVSILFLIASILVCFKFYYKPFNSHFHEQHSSIGGWLVLVAIGVCFTPLGLVIQIITQVKDELFLNPYTDMFDSSSTNYSPIRALYILLIDGLNIFLVVASVFLVFLLFQRKSSFRPYYVFFRCFNSVFLLFDLILMYYYASENSLDDSININKETTQVIRVFIQTCIWAPYVWFSERSKHTFTNGNIEMRPQENTETMKEDVI